MTLALIGEPGPEVVELAPGATVRGTVLGALIAGELAGLGFVDRRKFDPDQPRDPGGENGGQWVDSPTSYAIDAFEALYSQIIDEAQAGDLVVSVHENGDFVLAHLDEDGNRSVIFDGLTPQNADSIADGLDWATSQHIPDDAENDPSTRLVDWEYFEDDIIVGYDIAGDVSVRFPRSDKADANNLADFEVLDMGSEDAGDLADALRDMADRHDELDLRSLRKARRAKRAELIGGLVAANLQALGFRAARIDDPEES